MTSNRTGICSNSLLVKNTPGVLYLYTTTLIEITQHALKNPFNKGFFNACCANYFISYVTVMFEVILFSPFGSSGAEADTLSDIFSALVESYIGAQHPPLLLLS